MAITNGVKQHLEGPRGPPLPKLRPSGARLLSLDGGGVKGVSPVTILDNIMERVKKIEIENGADRSTADRKPVDYFDLAAGTSTGGLIALMLFRLRMTTKECLAEYHTLAEDVFAPRLGGFAFKRPGIMHSIAKNWMLAKMFLGSSGIYKNDYLKTAIDAVVSRHGLDANDRTKLKGQAGLVHPQAGMMFMCTTLAAKGESILMRSYPHSHDALPVTKWARKAAEDKWIDKVSIQIAALSTSAAPFFLPQVPWTPGGKDTEMIFWDGGMLNNNPVMQLWNARYDLVGEYDPEPKVDCVLSLGCSYNTPSSFKLTVNPIVRAVCAMGFITNTEAKAHDFEEYVQRMANRNDHNKDLKYFRFDVNTGNEVFGMDDAARMPKLEQLTREWLTKEHDEELQAFALQIAKKPGEKEK